MVVGVVTRGVGGEDLAQPAPDVEHGRRESVRVGAFDQFETVADRVDPLRGGRGIEVEGEPE